MIRQKTRGAARGNLFARYFVSFICIILIPVILFSGLLYYFVARRMDMALEDRLESTAQAMASQMDSLLIQLEGDVTRFALEMESSDLIASPLSTEQKMLRLAELRKRLESSASTNPAIDVIGVYFGGEKKILSQRGYYAEGAELDWSPINTLLQNEQVNGIHTYWREDGTTQIIVGKSIPLQLKKGRNFVICTLDTNVLKRYAQYGWEEAASFVLDHQGRVLLSSLPGALPAGAWPDSGGRMPGQGTRFKTISSKVMPWQYAISVTGRAAETDAHRFLWAILLIMAVLIGLGTAFSYMLAHVFYRPIAHLAHSARMELAKIRGKEVAPTPNDLLFIDQAVSAISAYGTALEQCLGSGRGRVLSSIFRHLLDGNAIQREEVHEILENYMFATGGRQFTVFVAAVGAGDIHQKWDGWISRYQLESTLRDMLGSPETREAAAVEMEKYRLCGIISQPLEEESLPPAFFDQLLARLGAHWPYARLAVGGTVHNLMDIAGPYAAAVQAIALTPAKQNLAVVDAAGQAFREPGTPGLTYRWLESVANNILVEDGRMVEQMVNEWFDGMVMAQNATLSALREAALQATGYLGVVLRERMPEVANWPSPITLEQAAQTLHPEDVRQVMLHFCHRAVACIKAETQQQGSGRLLQAVQYVDAHFREDISLTQVADLMEMTPQYLSSAFKSQVGRNFTEYINHMRLMESARLLKETGRTVQQIAQQVGYNSVQYFARKFKEAFGITPTQYRESPAKE